MTGTATLDPDKRGPARICMAGEALPFGVFDKLATGCPGAVVENKCLKRKRP